MIDQYSWTGATTAPAAGGQGHIDYLQVCGIMFEAWRTYLVPGLGLDRSEVHGAVRPIVKSVAAEFAGEIGSYEPLRFGARTASRTRRSFVIETALFRAVDPTVVAAGSIGLVAFDSVAGRAVEIPAALWAAVERLEERPIAEVGR